MTIMISYVLSPLFNGLINFKLESTKQVIPVSNELFDFALDTTTTIETFDAIYASTKMLLLCFVIFCHRPLRLLLRPRARISLSIFSLLALRLNQY